MNSQRNPQKLSPTGRIVTSSSPTLQNIPVRTIEGARIRQATLKALGLSPPKS